MTIRSWALYLGLSTIVISAPAGAQPLAAEVPQPEARLKSSLAKSTQQPIEADQPDQILAAQPSVPLNPPLNPTAGAATPAFSPESDRDSRIRSTASPASRSANPTDISSAADPRELASPAQTSPTDALALDPAAAEPARSEGGFETAPSGLTAEISGSQIPDSTAATTATATVTVSAETCLADCNPSERFFFNPPAMAIPPRSVQQPMQPMLAQTQPFSPAPLPVPSVPATPNSSSTTSDSFTPPTSPPPLSTPNRQAPDASSPSPDLSAPSPTLQSPQAPSPGSAADLADVPGPRRALTPPSLQFQGVYLYQGGEDSARFRVTGVYPILPELQVGASVDFTDGDIFSEGGDDGLSINELYVAASIPNYPNLRFIVGQIDLTSYFDRNSFAKDSATQFFNPVFATNPALSAAGLGSRQGAVVNWTILDELEAKAAVFSSDRSISEFAVNGFAGEVGLRLGNFILRGTYVTSEDSGADTSFEEAFSLARSNGDFGLRDGDREDGYGLNAEFFIPEINLGLFARYGWYENRDLGEGGTTYSFGVNLLDLFMEGDRLGVGYGRLLSNNDLRDGDNPDAFEAFYDFRILDFLRLGVTFQALDEFSETIAGFRIRTDFDLVPRREP